MTARQGPGPVLRADGLVRHFGGLRAVDGVDVEVPPGRVTAVIGPNGAGKSTLFHCLAGAQRPDAGRIRFGDRDITRLADHRRARLGIARTFQVVSVFATLTVADNLRVGAENRAGTRATARLFGLPEAGRADDAVEDALARVGLTALRDVPCGRLPTGTLRLVELGRALASRPSVLLLDEPASGLDDAETDRLRTLLRALADEGLAVLLVEHDMALVFGVADTVHVMAAGRVVASGPPERVRTDAAARAAYLDPATGDGGAS
ncbi:ABC transporter ATP-binding protein [Yinghuangia sp. ASG 101]|uniref:ABC transporter ATP-binding protein n=1 Tax=Yinghuangia sp. ASG 101 TaxID=2896848 RepID=UPI001E455197|nr:ABC transporter ATP-binding protein [Yinghuangia sp. ASG 101]UGQ10199.1 ABC transporter ATP-binding protein [Yinghuangia sp. ASG 101]